MTCPKLPGPKQKVIQKVNQYQRWSKVPQSCPTHLRLERDIYYDLLDAQRADGRFDWPSKFLQHFFNEGAFTTSKVQQLFPCFSQRPKAVPANQVFSCFLWVGGRQGSSSPFLPTSLAVAALRRCFPKWGALVVTQKGISFALFKCFGCSILVHVSILTLKLGDSQIAMCKRTSKREGERD